MLRTLVFASVFMGCFSMVVRNVDFRSDTVTKPSQKMRKAMSEALVGDDVLGDDPTVYELESKIALAFNKEASLFMPSGTMANLAAIMGWCGSRGSEMICGHQSHTYLYEQGGYAQIAGVSSRVLQNNPDGTIDIDSIEESIRPTNIHFPTTELVTLENTHNMFGGVCLPDGYLPAVKAICARRGLPLHLDGARIWYVCFLILFLTIYDQASLHYHGFIYIAVDLC